MAGVWKEQNIPGKAAQLSTFDGLFDAWWKEWPKLPLEKRAQGGEYNARVTDFEQRMERLEQDPGKSGQQLRQEKEVAEWNAFINAVASAWHEFEASNYTSNRGPAFPSRLRTDYVKKELEKLREFKAGGRTYTKSDSRTSPLSFHTPIPGATGNVRSFIVHFY